jgi:ribosomal-protein-alanine N-acetyltransferase
VIENMERPDLLYVVEPMKLEDIPEVVEIERLAFPSPWPARAYRYEVTQNQLAHYFVVRRQSSEEPGKELEVGERSLLRRIQTWAQSGERDHRPMVGYCGFWIAAQEAHISTIAVDPRFRGQGIGQLMLVKMIERALEYYSDNREDALIMTADHLSSPPFRRVFDKRRKQLSKRLEQRTRLSRVD